jgi:hypothetical protein
MTSGSWGVRRSWSAGGVTKKYWGKYSGKFVQNFNMVITPSDESRVERLPEISSEW